MNTFVGTCQSLVTFVLALTRLHWNNTIIVVDKPQVRRRIGTLAEHLRRKSDQSREHAPRKQSGGHVQVQKVLHA